MKFKIYTTEYCGFCTKAKKTLDELGHTYEEVSLDDTQEKTKFKKETGHKTVPQIYLDEDGDYKHIGGYSELKEWISD